MDEAAGGVGKTTKIITPAIESLNTCLIASQTPESGGYSHKLKPEDGEDFAEVIGGLFE